MKYLHASLRDTFRFFCSDPPRRSNAVRDNKTLEIMLNPDALSLLAKHSKEF
jgi:hypothetical protein